jgi:hypothetical protein
VALGSAAGGVLVQRAAARAATATTAHVEKRENVVRMPRIL